MFSTRPRNWISDYIFSRSKVENVVSEREAHRDENCVFAIRQFASVVALTFLFSQGNLSEIRETRVTNRDVLSATCPRRLKNIIKRHLLERPNLPKNSNKRSYCFSFLLTARSGYLQFYRYALIKYHLSEKYSRSRTRKEHWNILRDATPFPFSITFAFALAFFLEIRSRYQGRDIIFSFHFFHDESTKAERFQVGL